MTKELTLTPADFAELLTGGAGRLYREKQSVNDLNVFPIPDGDTGDNMYMTMRGGISAITENPTNAGELAHAVADGMVLSARGNSGVILSQLFSGLAEGLEGAESIDSPTLYHALESAVRRAYAAVVTPVEGTILTVAREATEALSDKALDTLSPSELLSLYIEKMKASLDNTPELLPVLKESGVVDSGGAGLVLIFEGMLAALQGEGSYTLGEARGETKTLDLSAFGTDSVMTYGYCTELLLRIQRSKVEHPEDFDVNTITGYLETVGDSIAAFKTDTIVKIHVHTLTPQLVLGFCQQFGEFLTIKIENMTLQHSDVPESFIEKKNEKKKTKRARRPFSTVAVATGKGLADTYREFGADIILEGGQTKNPSVEDFLEAFEDANADEIFVLPNNSNIIMAARGAAEIFSDSKIHVIETKSFGEGYSVLSMLDYSSGIGEAIAEQMRNSMHSSVTGMITSSIRTVTLDSVDIKEGEYIGFTNKTMLACCKTHGETFRALLKKLGADEREFLIVFFGEGTNDTDIAEAESYVKQEYPALEYYFTKGGQEVYSHIVIME